MQSQRPSAISSASRTAAGWHNAYAGQMLGATGMSDETPGRTLVPHVLIAPLYVPPRYRPGAGGQREGAGPPGTIETHSLVQRAGYLQRTAQVMVPQQAAPRHFRKLWKGGSLHERLPHQTAVWAAATVAIEWRPLYCTFVVGKARFHAAT